MAANPHVLRRAAWPLGDLLAALVLVLGGAVLAALATLA
jgi:hypothetical protein